MRDRDDINFEAEHTWCLGDIKIIVEDKNIIKVIESAKAGRDGQMKVRVRHDLEDSK